jgi:hypothetical protein
MEMPQIRPGKVEPGEPMPRVIAFFSNSAIGNSVIQQLTTLGLPNDRLGVTPPERIEGGQGMLLSIACPTLALISKVEELCRRHGADIRRQNR